MKGKMKIIILVALAGLSFAGSFFLSKLTSEGDKTSKAPREQSQQAAGGLEQPSDLSIPAGVSSPGIHMKERELDRLAKELRLKLEAVSAREDEIEKREKRLKLAEKLLKKQAEELENLRVQLVTPLTRLREEQAKLQNMQVAVSQRELENIKRTAKIYESMEPSKGGKIFTSMCKNKQEEDVVKILYFMSERNAAKMLAAITDTELAARLCQKLKKVSKQEG